MNVVVAVLLEKYLGQADKEDDEEGEEEEEEEEEESEETGFNKVQTEGLMNAPSDNSIVSNRYTDVALLCR